MASCVNVSQLEVYLRYEIHQNHAKLFQDGS